VPFVAVFCGLVLIAVILWEGFETIVLPRRVTRRFRLTRFFYRCTWRPWTKMVNGMVPQRWRQTFLSVFGPLSLLLLLSVWAAGLIVGYALLHWAAGSAVLAQDGSRGFLTDLYLSGTTFFTLGIGDVVPRSPVARLLVVTESGMGLAFLALVIGYLPALNQSFARREVSISLLDARAGSPPTASEMLRRHADDGGMAALRQLLYEWERWSAEFLEGHLSYPVLGYFRSQHDNESWLAALTAILDTCALIMVGAEIGCERQAKRTFAMARHVVVDLCLVFRTPPHLAAQDRLPPDALARLRTALASVGIALPEGEAADRKLHELRWMYEPYIHALATYFRFAVPPWQAEAGRKDNWQGNIEESGSTAGRRRRKSAKGEHF
jgi:Ion channel